MNIQEILDRVKVYLDTILSRKWLMMSLALVLGMGLAVWAVLSPKKYIATTVFHPESGAGAGGSGINLDPLALLMGASLGSESSQQIVGVLQSRSVSESVVADSIEWDSAKYLIADLIIEKNPRSWNPVSLLKRALFPPDSVTYEGKIISSGIQMRSSLKVEMTEEGFISFSLGHYDPRLTQILAEAYIHHLEDYYTNQKTEKAQLNVDFFTDRTDSIKNELDKVAASRARVMDQEQYRVFARDQISTAELDIKLQMLQEMYIQLVTSREQFIAQLKRETPVIQVLDPPRPPFDVVAPSPVKWFLIGVFLVVFLLSIWLTRHLWIEDGRNLIMASLQSNEEAREDSQED